MVYETSTITRSFLEEVSSLRAQKWFLYLQLEQNNKV